MRLGVTYIPVHLPDHMKRDLAELAEIGCKDVLFAIQENHLSTLQGPLRWGADLARGAGLNPQAVIWGFLNTFGGGRMSLIMLNDPSLWRINKDGRAVPEACLNNPAIMDHLASIATRLRDAGFGTIFIDEPSGQECFCPHCQKAFAALADRPLSPAAIDTEAYHDFQRHTVIDYIRRGCRRVKGVDARLQTVCCVMPQDRRCWAGAAEIKDLDMLGTDPYWLIPFCKLSLPQALNDGAELKRICEQHRKQSQMWLNCWAIPEGAEPQILEGGRQLAGIGFDSFFTWSYRGGLGTNEQCARPDLAWQQVVTLYKELSGLAPRAA